ncbi:hypothetical protein [Spirosoma panaciterrae]|uniref:hypothetical protein n=1 Tax=Spirosoma panaciterrae TaxID=496058 RepID=UPI000376BB26|nr:hypothetical protein [Spirosoma panaciterrae]
MNLSRILLGLLVILNGGIKIQPPVSPLPFCIAGEFRFGDLTIPYPATVGQIAKAYHMKFVGAGSFQKDTMLFQKNFGPPIHLYLHHAGMQRKFDSSPNEDPKESYEQPILEYRFTVGENVYSFDSLRTMIEKEAGKTFRAFPAASYSSPSSPWRPLLKGRTLFVYSLRISECMAVNLMNFPSTIPGARPDIKTYPFTSVNFILYKTDKEIEQMYESFEARNKDLLRRRDSLMKN